jgi:hypothetical protein
MLHKAEKDNLDDMDREMSIILKRILQEKDGRVQTEFAWIRVMISGYDNILSGSVKSSGHLGT